MVSEFCILITKHSKPTYRYNQILTNNANAYLGAPYGIYQTKDGYLALAMMPVDKLGGLLGCVELEAYHDPASWFDQRDEIKQIIQNCLIAESNRYWLDILEPADVWCAEVLNWDQLFAHDGFKELNFTQRVKQSSGTVISTTRCPIRIDGTLLFSEQGSPKIGEHNGKIMSEYKLKN